MLRAIGMGSEIYPREVLSLIEAKSGPIAQLVRAHP